MHFETILFKSGKWTFFRSTHQHNLENSRFFNPFLMAKTVHEVFRSKNSNVFVPSDLKEKILDNRIPNL